PPTSLKVTGTDCGGIARSVAASVTTTTVIVARAAATRIAEARSAVDSGATPSRDAATLAGEPSSTMTRGAAPARTNETRASTGLAVSVSSTDWRAAAKRVGETSRADMLAD